MWGDLLTAYDGTAITYDEIGNPDKIGDWEYTWKHGRELASMSNDTETWEFTYNADGLRTQRTNWATMCYSYVYTGSSLTQMTVDGDTLFFHYDVAGVPLTVTWNGTTYYYATNLQGDIVAILDSTGTAVVSYTYDAWGNHLSISGTMAATLGQLNPLRYRGYVYDIETGLYYLQSRYYNPEIGRFLNADAFATTGQGFAGNNMFVYCLNNPVVFYDIGGYFAGVASVVPAVPAVAEFIVASVSNIWNPAGWIALGVTVGVIVVVIIVDNTAASPQKLPSPKKEEKPIPYPSPKPNNSPQKKKKDNDTIIYRWARHRNTSAKEYQNLTPRPVDKDGISFSLIPSTTKDNATTTIGALRAAGFTCIVKGDHVSVIPPGGSVALDDWRASHRTANTNPHELTLLLYSIVY